MDAPGSGFAARSQESPAPPPGRTHLGRAAVGGVTWEAASFVLGKLSTFVATVILARILTPEDFGVVALALVFVTYVEVVTDLGVSQALIYLPAAQRNTDAAVAVSMLWAVALAGAVVLGAPLIADFFEQPEVAPMVRVLSLSLLLGGIGSVPDALLRKRLLFRRRLVSMLARSGSRGAIAVILAVLGFGAWSIIWAHAASQLVWMVAGWLLVESRPTRRFWRPDRSNARRLLGFGLPAAGNALLLAVIFNIDYLIVGEFLGAEDLGFYTIAYRIPEILILQAMWVVSAVSFPLYSLARDDPRRLRRGYLTGVRLQAFYGTAAGVGLAVAAPMLVPVVFGPQWTASIDPLRAIALYAIFGSLAKGAMDLLKGTGRPGMAVGLSLLRLALVIPALVFATRFGINGVAWAQAIVSFIVVLLLQSVAARLIDLPLGQLARTLKPAVAAAVGIALGAGAVALWLPGSDAVRLVAALLAGGAAALGVLSVADGDFVRETWSLVRQRPRRVHGDVAPAP